MSGPTWLKYDHLATSPQRFVLAGLRPVYEVLQLSKSKQYYNPYATVHSNNQSWRRYMLEKV